MNNIKNNSNNGRVDITNCNKKPWGLFEQENSGNKIYKEEALKTIQSCSPLSNAFFSKKNIDIIQNSIRYNVWKESNEKHVIARQSDVQLQIIMRSVFLQYSKNIPTNIEGQINSLNRIVVNFCVPKILSEVKQYIIYKNTVSELPQPLERPKQTTTKGSKTLELKKFI